MVYDLAHKIKRKLKKLWLHPIRVFCFHQTSELFDPKIYTEPDWIALQELKQKLLGLKQEGYVFISLSDAFMHICEDKIRLKKYAVLTCDDGLKCQADLIPWLEEQHIPMTMFVNITTMDGKTCGEQIVEYYGIKTIEDEAWLAKQLYMTKEDLMQLDSPIIEIGLHGYDHSDVTTMSLGEFEKDLKTSIRTLQSHNRYVPFYAYAYGRHTNQTDEQLRQMHIVPIYIDGQTNYNDASCIHRELI